MAAKDQEYQSLLDAGQGVMGSIRIPEIDVNLPIYTAPAKMRSPWARDTFMALHCRSAANPHTL